MLKVYRLNFDDEKFAEVRHVRNDVFVVVQGVSETDEYDEFESSARHYLITKMMSVVGLLDGENRQRY